MDANGRNEDVMAAAKKNRRTNKENMNKNKQGSGRRRGRTHGAWTGASGKQHTQSGTSVTEAQDWNIRGRYGFQCSGQHQEEEAAAARRKGEEGTNKSKMQRRATAEAGTGLRQSKGWRKGGRGEGQRQDAEGKTQGTEQGGGEKK